MRHLASGKREWHGNVDKFNTTNEHRTERPRERERALLFWITFTALNTFTLLEFRTVKPVYEVRYPKTEITAQREGSKFCFLHI